MSSDNQISIKGAPVGDYDEAIGQVTPNLDLMATFDRWKPPYSPIRSKRGQSYCEHLSFTSIGSKTLLSSLNPSRCDLCALVKAVLSSVLSDEPGPESAVGLKLRKEDDRSPKIIYEAERYSSDQAWDLSPVKDTNRLPQPICSFLPFHDIVEDPLGDAGLQRIRSWVDDCRDNHRDCPDITAAPLPKRVVDVVNLRLYESHGEIEDYVALSHCWGDQSTFTTTTANLVERCTSLNWQDLPQSFKDAVSITKALQLRYVWIDSLCILQDNRLDWDVESARMADVYRNSYLTIAASCSSGDHEGFLHRRLEYTTVVRNVELPSGIKEEYKIRARIKHSRYPLGGSSQTPPLETRAWCFQERLVPHRLVSFPLHEMEWNCRMMRSCECKSRPLNNDSGAERVKLGMNLRLDTSNLHAMFQKLLHLLDEVPNTQTGHHLRNKIYRCWQENIIPPYSLLKLSVSSDRLPAISALAGLLAPKLTDNYLAGLWRRDLARGITWQASWPGVAYSPHDPSVKYRAPSWSWASIEGPIISFRPLDEALSHFFLAEVLDAHCSPLGSSEFGEVSSGSIVIRTEALWASLSLDETAIPDAASGTAHTFSLEIPWGPRRFCADTLLVQRRFAGGETVSRTRFPTGERGKAASVPVLCAAVVGYELEELDGLMSDYDEPEPFHRLLGFLVLAPSPTSTGKFERIGVLERVRWRDINKKLSQMDITII